MKEDLFTSERDKNIVEIVSIAEDVKTVAKAVKPASKAVANKGGSVLQKTRTAVTAAGYMAAPLTEGASLALVPVGHGISTTDAALEFGVNMSDGDYMDAGVAVASHFASSKLEKTISNAANARKIAKADEHILKFISDAWSEVANFFYDKSKDK